MERKKKSKKRFNNLTTMADRKKFKKDRGPRGWHVSGGGGGKSWKNAVKNVAGAIKGIFKRKRPKKSKTKTSVKKAFIVSPRYIGLENTYSAKTLRKHGYKIKNK